MRKLDHDKTDDARTWLSDPYTQKKAAELRRATGVSLRALINAAATTEDARLRQCYEEYVALVEQAKFFSGGSIAEDNE